MNKTIIVLPLFLLSSLLNLSAFAGDIAAGKAKSATCVACHQADGNSATGMYPKIAGQHASYAAKQIREIITGDTRQSAVMQPMVQNLSDTDIEDLAAYFASQKISESATDKQYVDLGQAIYRGGIAKKALPACSGCHGPAGLGNGPAKFPRLAGQHADYTIDQLNKFAKGERSNDPNGVMRDIASRLSEEEMTAVAHFIQGLYSEEG